MNRTAQARETSVTRMTQIPKPRVLTASGLCRLRWSPEGQSRWLVVPHLRMGDAWSLDEWSATVFTAADAARELLRFPPEMRPIEAVPAARIHWKQAGGPLVRVVPALLCEWPELEPGSFDVYIGVRYLMQWMAFEDGPTAWLLRSALGLVRSGSGVRLWSEMAKHHGIDPW